MKNKGKHSV